MLSQKKDQQEFTKEKPKSEKASTNLSEGSQEADEEFKQKKGQKFEFVNQNINQWPQWEVKEEKTQGQKTKEQVEELDFSKYDYMYSRGFSRPIPIRKKQPVQQSKESKEKKVEKKKESFLDKIKNWFN